jgi:hypothetical protein
VTTVTTTQTPPWRELLLSSLMAGMNPTWSAYFEVLTSAVRVAGAIRGADSTTSGNVLGSGTSPESFTSDDLMMSSSSTSSLDLSTLTSVLGAGAANSERGLAPAEGVSVLAGSTTGLYQLAENPQGIVLAEAEWVFPWPRNKADLIVPIFRDMCFGAFNTCRQILSSLDIGDEMARDLARIRLHDVLEICRTFADQLTYALAEVVDSDPDTLSFLLLDVLVRAGGVTESMKSEIFVRYASHHRASIRYAAVRALDALADRSSINALKLLEPLERNPDIRSMIQSSIQSH